MPSFLELFSFSSRFLKPVLTCLDVELVRGRHHGQLRLPDERLVHLGRSPPGRVHPDLGRVRPQRHVRQNFCFNLSNPWQSSIAMCPAAALLTLASLTYISYGLAFFTRDSRIGEARRGLARLWQGFF